MADHDDDWSPEVAASSPPEWIIDQDADGRRRDLDLGREVLNAPNQLSMSLRSPHLNYSLLAI